MSTAGTIARTLFNVADVADATAEYLPEPASTGVGIFGDIMDAVGEISGGDVGGVPTELSGSFEDLLQLQIMTQIELQSVSMVSNVEKSKHESKMAAIRNVRVN